MAENRRLETNVLQKEGCVDFMNVRVEWVRTRKTSIL